MEVRQDPVPIHTHYALKYARMNTEEGRAPEEFEAATAFVASLAARDDLGEGDLLRLYGLYKVATEGRCSTKRPSIFDPKGRIKWGAWEAVGDLPPPAAAAAYVELLSELRPQWRGEAREAKGGAVGPVFSSLAHDAGDEAVSDAGDCLVCPRPFNISISTLNHCPDHCPSPPAVHCRA